MSVSVNIISLESKNEKMIKMTIISEKMMDTAMKCLYVREEQPLWKAIISPALLNTSYQEILLAVDARWYICPLRFTQSRCNENRFGSFAKLFKGSKSLIFQTFVPAYISQKLWNEEIWKKNERRKIWKKQELEIFVSFDCCEIRTRCIRNFALARYWLRWRG